MEITRHLVIAIALTCVLASGCSAQPTDSPQRSFGTLLAATHLDSMDMPQHFAHVDQSTGHTIIISQRENRRYVTLYGPKLRPIDSDTAMTGYFFFFVNANSQGAIAAEAVGEGSWINHTYFPYDGSSPFSKVIVRALLQGSPSGAYFHTVWDNIYTSDAIVVSSSGVVEHRLGGNSHIVSANDSVLCVRTDRDVSVLSIPSLDTLRAIALPDEYLDLSGMFQQAISSDGMVYALATWTGVIIHDFEADQTYLFEAPGYGRIFASPEGQHVVGTYGSAGGLYMSIWRRSETGFVCDPCNVALPDDPFTNHNVSWLVKTVFIGLSKCALSFTYRSGNLPGFRTFVFDLESRAFPATSQSWYPGLAGLSEEDDGSLNILSVNWPEAGDLQLWQIEP